MTGITAECHIRNQRAELISQAEQAFLTNDLPLYSDVRGDLVQRILQCYGSKGGRTERVDFGLRFSQV